ncbi:hypothetical protein AJN42_05850 [Listeria monocytogenes]|uniref:hypothetical protein n=1 Tax=Listeria monocytogenes TaxID=1639 RepID=UPI0008688BC3|nr:hypothetical protein [Listeria monocytogenes]EAG6783817.1 hypothetical protein [Listeria monocytogenes]OEQ99101.1 hypothetical protein AJN42_05850 [Listeria monocytogenes]
MRDIIKAGITEVKGKEPEFKINIAGSEQEQSFALAQIHYMKIERLATLKRKSFEQAKNDYLEALSIIVGTINDNN